MDSSCIVCIKNRDLFLPVSYHTLRGEAIVMQENPGSKKAGEKTVRKNVQKTFFFKYYVVQ